MMMTNNAMRGVQHEHVEEKNEDVKVEEKETVHLSAESMTDIAKMVSSMLETETPSHEIKCLHEKMHELDKRIAICEALIHNIK